MVVQPVHLLIKTADTKVFNVVEHYADIASAMAQNQPIVLDFLSEGPDLHCLDIYTFIIKEAKRYNYDVSNVTVLTCNALETDNLINIVKSQPQHLAVDALEYDAKIMKNQELNHFGLFINRTNPARLFLASQIYKNHSDKMLHTNHLDLTKEWYASNLSLDDVIQEFGADSLQTISEYIGKCPINTVTIEIDKLQQKNAALQLINNDREIFLSKYRKFFVEIVCETYYTGQTFFPTEKIWRPILLRTPFIVQGPRGFVKQLHNLGFKTFSAWWNEGYNDNEGAWAVREILNLIEILAAWSPTELYQIYQSMQSVLDHNRQRFFELWHSKFR